MRVDLDEDLLHRRHFRANAALDFVDQLFDLLDDHAFLEGDLHRENDDVRPDVEREELRDLLDAGAAFGDLERLAFFFRLRARADDEAVRDAGENDRDDGEQEADEDAADGVEDLDPGQLAGEDGEERDRQTNERGRVLGEDERNRGIARLANRGEPVAALGQNLELAPRDAEAHRLEEERDAEDAVAPPARARLVDGVENVLRAVEDRERAAEREEHQRDDERPEVLFTRAAERVLRVRRLQREPHADQQQALIARVGDGVDRLGERGGRAGHVGGTELAERDRDVSRERRDDYFSRIGAFAGFAMTHRCTVTIRTRARALCKNSISAARRRSTTSQRRSFVRASSNF